VKGQLVPIGRDADLARVAAILAEAGRCTIVGPGGVGKSTLARAVAAVASRPIVWVDAEPLADMDAAADELLRQIGAERLPGQGSVAAAASALEGTGALVVLDGVEHLGEAVLDGVELLTGARDSMWLLLTSRFALGASMRPLLRLAPLPVRGFDDAGQRLLRAALTARGADVSLLAQDQARWQHVVRSTGGLPAAIELTADYVARFGTPLDDDLPVPIEGIIERCLLRTLNLLPDTDRRAFLQLSLSAGSFAFDAAANLTGTEPSQARRMVATFVDHGLLLATNDRFDLLPPIRDGAYDLLVREGTADQALARALGWADALAHAASDTSNRALAADLDTLVRIARLGIAAPTRHPGLVRLVHALFDPMYRQLRWRELLGLLETLADSTRLTLAERAETALGRPLRQRLRHHRARPLLA
jgi:hypothetical protein